jgi:hypothetical protein
MHQTPPLPDKANGISEGKHPSSYQGGILAEAMPSNKGGLGPAIKLRSNLKACHAHRHYRRLGIDGLTKFLLRTLKAEPRQGEAESLVSFLEYLPGEVRALIEVEPHPHYL